MMAGQRSCVLDSTSKPTQPTHPLMPSPPTHLVKEQAPRQRQPREGQPDLHVAQVAQRHHRLRVRHHQLDGHHPDERDEQAHAHLMGSGAGRGVSVCGGSGWVLVDTSDASVPRAGGPIHTYVNFTHHGGELDGERRHAHHHVGDPDERAHPQQHPGEEAGRHALLLGHDLGHHEPVRQVHAQPRAGREPEGEVPKHPAEDAGHAGAQGRGDHDLGRGEAHLLCVCICKCEMCLQVLWVGEWVEG